MTACGAVIYDMDGLMIDSEPLWAVTETAAFGAVGLTLNAAALLETTGLRIDEVAEHHFVRRGWDDEDGAGSGRADVARAIVDGMERLLRERAGEIAKPGLASSMDFFGTSSPQSLLDMHQRTQV